MTKIDLKNITLDSIRIKLLESETYEMNQIRKQKKEDSYFSQTGKYKKKDKLKSTWKW